MNKLKPCPFCGTSNAELMVSAEAGAIEVYVYCFTCGARTGGELVASSEAFVISCVENVRSALDQAEEAEIEAWNMRNNSTN